MRLAESSRPRSSAAQEGGYSAPTHSGRAKSIGRTSRLVHSASQPSRVPQLPPSCGHCQCYISLPGRQAHLAATMPFEVPCWQRFGVVIVIESSGPGTSWCSFCVGGRLLGCLVVMRSSNVCCNARDLSYVVAPFLWWLYTCSRSLHLEYALYNLLLLLFRMHNITTLCPTAFEQTEA